MHPWIRQRPDRRHSLRRGGPLWATVACLLWLGAACTVGPGRADAPLGVGADPHDRGWDDGRAVVATYTGRVWRYGRPWDVTVRDYWVREFLDPSSETKQDQPRSGDIPVLKINRLVTFSTETYPYWLLTAVHLARDGTGLVKGHGTCLNACGPVVQTWSRFTEELRSDSYWGGEGVVSVALPASGWVFADQLPFVAFDWTDGAKINVLGSLAAPASIVVAPSDQRSLVSLGLSGLAAPRAGPMASAARDEVPSVELTVHRAGNRVELSDPKGSIWGSFLYDSAGFLREWRVPGEQELQRVHIERSAYWEAAIAVPATSDS